MENFVSKNHSIENEVVKSTRVEKGTKSTKRKREESPYLKIRLKAVNFFTSQIDKSVKTKRLAVEKAMSKIIVGDYTEKRFLAEYKANVELLLDSKRFEKECEIHNLKPFNAATHIVLDGTSKIDLVLKNGILPNYSTKLIELVEPIFTEEELNNASTVMKSTETVE